MIREEVIYRGTVQGVGFRATVRSIARRHPVTGWVRNEPDGSVRMQAQGEPEAIAAFRADIREARAGFIASERTAEHPVNPAEADFVITH